MATFKFRKIESGRGTGYRIGRRRRNLAGLLARKVLLTVRDEDVIISTLVSSHAFIG